MNLYMKMIIVSVALLLRVGTSLHSYSGQDKPPMFGDFEAQRHWQEITVNLPIAEWYMNSTLNDLLYWGLDYPPLTAYHSYICGKVASSIDKDYIHLFYSRGIESASHKLFMRCTVILADIFVFIPSVLYFWTKFEYAYNQKQKDINIQEKSRNWSTNLFELEYGSVLYLSMILFYPGIILIDHGHFQYNNISLGLAILAISFLMGDDIYKGSVAFVLALNYKQMELYHAIPIFVYLLSISLKNRSKFQGLLQIIRLGLIVLSTFIILWLPFILDFNIFTQVIHRLFPFARGIFEDKVANFWCAINVIIKLKNILDISHMALLCLFMTFVSLIPCNIILFCYPNMLNFKYSLFNTALSFFLFSFQVHEKSILLVAIPALLLFKFEPLFTFWFLHISTFSMLPLFIKDQLLVAYLALNLFYSIVFVSFISLQPHPKTSRHNIFVISWIQDTISKETNSTFCTILLKISFHISIIGATLLCLASVLIKPPIKYPDLFPLLIAVFSCVHFLLFMLYFNLRLFYLNSTRKSPS